MVLGAQDILEPPDEPEPVSADDSDPVVVQEGVISGSGVGDEDRGDRDSEAVAGDADEKEITTQSGLEDTSQPLIEDSNDDGEPPSSPIVLQPVDENQAIPSSGEQLEQSTETTQVTQDDHPESDQILEQTTESSLPPQVESGTLEESTNQAEEGLTVEVPEQPISENTASEGAQEPRPLTPDIAEKSQIGSGVESPPSLTESQLPDQKLDEHQQVEGVVADSSDTGQPSVELPTVEEPTVEQPTVEEPTVEDPTVKGPTVEDLTVQEPPSVEQPALEEPTVEEPAVEEPAIEEATVEEATVEQSTLEEPPTVEQPSVEQPSDAHPGIEQPTVEKPAIEEPAIEEPAIEEPTVEQPTVEERTVESVEPSAEEPAFEGPPTVEQSPAEEPTVEEPAIEEPTVEQLSAAEPTAEEANVEEPPTVEESAIEQPTVKEPPTLEEPPTVEEPTVEQPSASEPIAVEPIAEEPTLEEPPTVEEPPAVEEPPTMDESTVEQPTVEEPSVQELSVEQFSDAKPSVEEPSIEESIVEQPSIEEPIVEAPSVEQPSVEAPSHDSPVLATSTLDQPSAALEVDSPSSENASGRQQEDESENLLPESTKETSINVDPTTVDQTEPESGITDDAALSQTRSPEDLQKDDGVPDSEKSDNVESPQVTDSVVPEQASDSEEIQPEISLEQDSQEIVSQTQLPESSLLTEPAQSSGEPINSAPELSVDQAENIPATLPSSTPSNLEPSNDIEGTMTTPVETPSDALEAQNDSQQLENAEALEETSGSGTTDISGELDRDLLVAELSQNEQDAPGPSLESSDVLPLDEQPSTVTGPLDSGDAQVLDESEPTGQGEVDGTNDALVVSPKRSAEELPPSTMEQAPSGDSSQPPLDTVINEEVVPSPSGPSTPIVEKQTPLADPEEGQDEPAQGSEEVMENADETQSHTGESGDDSQSKNDLEAPSTLAEEPVSPSQEQDQDIPESTEADNPPGASSQEMVDQSTGDVEAVVEPDSHVASSGHSSGQSTPTKVPFSSEIEASPHAPEGQEAPSSPTDQTGDHLEVSKESDSTVEQDEPQKDDIAAPEQPVADLATEPPADGLSPELIVSDTPGTDEDGPKEADSTQEVTTQDPVSQDIDQPSEMPSESGPDPVIDGKRSTESLSQQPDEQTSVDEDDIKNAGIVAATAAAAGIAVHELVSSKDDVEDSPVAVSGSTDDIQRPRTADKGTGTLEESTPDQNDLEVRSISSAAPDSPEEVSSQQPLSESFTIVDPPLSSDQGQAIPDSSEKPVLLKRVDSSTQTDELWRPKTPLPRGGTPGIELPDPNDAEAMGRSRARTSRRMSRQSVHQAEEVVAAAVIIRAAADTLGETSNRMAVHVKDLKQHGETTAPSNLLIDGRGTRVADTSIPYDFIADPITGKESSKTDEKLPRSPRSREHRASHSSRSSRPSTREDGTTRSSHHRHSSHRHRADGERESEQAPRTPPRHQDAAEGAHGSHSSRSRRERTPQEQAEHDRRKEERRLAREKEKAKADSPVTESKGKEVEAPPSADRSHRSSRRHSSTRHSVASPSNTARTEASTAAPSKKFFDMKNGQSVMGSSFGGPLTADSASTATKDKDTISSSRRSKEVSRPPPVELKRSSTTRSSKGVRRSLEQSHAKLQKARQEESTKAAKENQPRRDDSSSPSPADGKKSKDDDKHRKSRLEKREKEDKDEKKKSSGGLKGMFKRLFSN